MTAPGAPYDDSDEADGDGRARSLDLAARRGARRRPDRAAPLHDRVRQLPPARRAAHRPAQRDRRRAGRASSASTPTAPAAGRRSWPSPAQSDGAATGDRQGPPRLGLQGAAGAHRGRPQARPAALRGRHQQPRARHRHGRGRPRRPDRVAAERRQRAAARRPRRPPGRRGLAAACCSPSTAATSPRPRSRSSGCAPAPIESLRVPANPLDVLAQQVVAATALDAWDVDDLFALVRRTAPFAQLPRPAYDATLDLLSGRYPSDEFAELRPRIVWDRVDRHAHRPARRPAAGRHQRRHHPRPRPVRGVPGRRRGARPAGRRARRGDGLRVPGRRRLRARRDQLADRGHHPRPGAGHARARASPAGCRSGRATPSAGPPSSARRSARSPASSARCRATQAARARAERAASTRGPPTTWSAYLARAASRPPTSLPSDRTLVVERFRDELGDWRLVVHSPYGTPVHAPWALAINARLRERYGIDGQAIASDDGIVIRIPDTDAEPPGGEVIVFEPDEIERPGHPGGRRLGAVRRPASASARPGRCCCPAATPAGARRCGSSGSAAAPAARGRRRSTRPSRSCSRPSASASRTSTTCRRWSA